MLDAFLNAHPDLVVEAEGLAASILDDATWESVAEDVEYALRSLPLEALSDRAGYHPTLCSGTRAIWTTTPTRSSPC